MYALKELRENDYRFVEDPDSKVELEAYAGEIDNVATFFNSCILRVDEEHKVFSKDVYELYRKWCRDNLIESYKKEQFSRCFAMAYGKSATPVRIGDKVARGYKGLVLKKTDM